jgi:hypothetical protein
LIFIPVFIDESHSYTNNLASIASTSQPQHIPESGYSHSREREDGRPIEDYTDKWELRAETEKPSTYKKPIDETRLSEFYRLEVNNDFIQMLSAVTNVMLTNCDKVLRDCRKIKEMIDCKKSE